MSRIVQRIRYPPFELGHMNPSEVPVSEAEVKVNSLQVTDFTIGSADGWFVEWLECDEEDSNRLRLDSEISLNPPAFLTRSRLGWFINPDRLHHISRSLIYPTVVLLIVSLFIHVIEPVLVELGIIGNLGSVSIGPLEYPRLLFFTFPLFLMPLLFRTIANFRDMSRQAEIISNPFTDPEFNITENRKSTEVVVSDADRDLTLIRSRIQVGVPSPERRAVLTTLGRSSEGQPSPGMSTILPEKRISPGDEVGTGVGESTPMQSTTKRSVILEPMRIMSRSPWVSDIEIGVPFNIPMPDENWPGSVYSSLIAIHWEVVLEFEQLDGRRIAWVAPITMPQADIPTKITDSPVISGRAELSDI